VGSSLALVGNTAVEEGLVMNNEVTPLRDAFGKVIDFIVNPPCEGCRRRKKKLKKFAAGVSDRLRLHPRYR